jgi:hypothetical protein
VLVGFARDIIRGAKQRKATVKAEPIHETVPTLGTMRSNILATYGQATDEEISNGRAWYELAHLFASRLGRGDTSRGAGVIASLSPQTSWQENVRLAFVAFSSTGPSGHTGNNIAKARAILRGDDALDVLGGSKVLAFYRCILDPSNAYDVVIDRHAFAIAIGADLVASLDARYAPSNDATKYLARAGAYELIASPYRDAASELGILPHACQAVTWLTHRRMKRANVSTLTRFDVDTWSSDDALDDI